MDPYSAEGELVHMHSAYHQGQYQQVLDFDTSSFSSSNSLPAQVLKLRARIALNQNDEVIKEVGSQNTPDLQAAKILAQWRKAPREGNPAVRAAQDLAGKQGDNLSVQICCGSVLADADMVEEALALLSKHQGSLDAVALIVQIHLQQNRLDLAKKEAANARKWAQDSLLVNIAESWVGMREGGEKYQASYYVFEELAQNPSTQSVTTLVGQAIAELHLGRLPEAEAAMQQALQLDPENADALANAIALSIVLGKDSSEYEQSLRRVKANHMAITDMESKREEFKRASARYTPKFAV